MADAPALLGFLAGLGATDFTRISLDFKEELEVEAVPNPDGSYDMTGNSLLAVLEAMARKPLTTKDAINDYITRAKGNATRLRALLEATSSGAEPLGLQLQPHPEQVL